MRLLQLENIYKNFGEKFAVKDVSVSIENGKIYGLLGPNGAGKTTLIRIINQIIKPSKGRVLYKERPIIPEDVYSMGYLPEERGLYYKMKVKDYLLFIAKLKNMNDSEAKVAIADWAKKLNFESWQNKRIANLSKGMAQLIQFVATVIHNPELIILDEPFSGFDPVNAEKIKKEIQILKNEGKTILLSTHNMNSVEELCDHIFMINQSEKIIDGSLIDVQDEVGEIIYSVQFKGQMIAFVNALWTGYEIVKTEELPNDRSKVFIKMRNDNKINDLFAAIKEVVEIEALQKEKVSLEELFIQHASGKESGDE